MKSDTSNRVDNESNQIVYRSRYSIILLLILIATLIILAYAFINEPKSLIALIIVVPVIVMILGFQYVIKGDILIFRTWGLKSGSVTIDSITKIERSYLVLSSNAGSFKRLYISMKKGSKYPYLLISPIREAEFIEYLISVNPQIEVIVENKSGSFRFLDWDI